MTSIGIHQLVTFLESVIFPAVPLMLAFQSRWERSYEDPFVEGVIQLYMGIIVILSIVVNAYLWFGPKTVTFSPKQRVNQFLLASFLTYTTSGIVSMYVIYRVVTFLMNWGGLGPVYVLVVGTFGLSVIQYFVIKVIKWFTTDILKSEVLVNL